MRIPECWPRHDDALTTADPRPLGILRSLESGCCRICVLVYNHESPQWELLHASKMCRGCFDLRTHWFQVLHESVTQFVTQLRQSLVELHWSLHIPRRSLLEILHSARPHSQWSVCHVGTSFYQAAALFSHLRHFLVNLESLQATSFWCRCFPLRFWAISSNFGSLM